MSWATGRPAGSLIEELWLYNVAAWIHGARVWGPWSLFPTPGSAVRLRGRSPPASRQASGQRGELGDGYGPRVAESGIGLITNLAGSVPYEELRLKGK